MNNGMVRRNSRAVVAGSVRSGAVVGGYRVGRQALNFLARNARWGSGRSGPATASRYFPYMPSPPYQYKRSAPSLFSPYKKVAKIAGNGIRKGGGKSNSKVIYKKKKYTKRVIKRKWRKKKNRVTVNMTNGITARNETIQKVEDLQCVYVGHATYASDQIIQFVSRAIVKAMWAKEGIVVENDQTGGPAFASAYRISYYPTPTALVSTTIASAAIAVSANFGQHVNALVALIFTLTEAADNQFKFQTFSWESTPTLSDYRFKHSCNMIQSKLYINVRSMLSFQNTTANALNTNATDVNNNNPVTITKYYGKGNGSEFVVRPEMGAVPAYTSFICDPARGSIAVPARVAPGLHLDEPPSSKLFQYAKGGSKFTLQPGSIYKTSLSDNMVMSLSAYMHVMKGYAVNVRQRLFKGSFEFFGAEKVCTTSVSGGASNVPVEIDYEIDQKFSTKFVPKIQSMTLPVNSTQVVLPAITVT